jgi:hypothetical protein
MSEDWCSLTHAEHDCFRDLLAERALRTEDFDVLVMPDQSVVVNHRFTAIEKRYMQRGRWLDLFSIHLYRAAFTNS